MALFLNHDLNTLSTASGDLILSAAGSVVEATKPIVISGTGGLVVETGDVYFNNGALISNDADGHTSFARSGTNIDHIWHEDGANTWHFVSDGTYKQTGNAALRAGSVTATTFTGALSGNATTATAWATGRTITLTGDVTGVSAAWTGSGNISFATTIAALSVDTGMIGNSQVTYAKIQNVSATSRFLGRITAAAGVIEELTAANAWTILGVIPDANISGAYTGLTDVTASGTVTSGMLRLTTTADVTLASTTHAFQIGATASANLAIDGNEIQGRNNGAAALVGINLNGGDVSLGGGASTITADGNLTVTGNLIVSGTTVTVNSTTVTVDDPIFTLGGDTAPGADDNKDRGIEFRWHNGTVAKVGFFGFDDSTGRMIFIPDATNTAEVFTGTLGDIQATTFIGALSGNATTATAWATGRTITLTGDVTGVSAAWTGSGNISFATTIAALAIDTGMIAASAVTYAKIQNVTATSRILGRITAGAGVIEELTAANVYTILGAVPNANISGTYTGFTGITSSGTVTISVGAGTAGISLTNATSNWIDYGTAGTAAPALTTRSAGTKLILYNAVSGSAVDYGIGIESGAMWLSVATTSNSFKWYAGTTLVMQLSGGSVLSGLSSVTATTFTGALSGNATTATAWATGRTIALTGDVTGTSAAWTGSGNISFATTIAANAIDTGMIANSQVTYAKIQNVSATSRILGRITAGAGVIEELTAANVWTIIGPVPNGELSGSYTGITGITATTFTGALSGNATTATAWATGRTITLTGDITGVSAAWTGSGNISFATTIAANAVQATMISNRDSSNMFPDPDMMDPAFYSGAFSLSTVAADGGSSKNQLSIAAHGTLDNDVLTGTIQVGKSTPYFVSVMTEISGTGANQARAYFITYSDVAGTVQLTSTQFASASSTTPTYNSAQITTDATAKSARILFRNLHVDGAKSAHFSDMSVRRCADVDLLVGLPKALYNLGTTGIIVRSAADTVVTRSIAVSGTGLSVTNADGVSGNPTVTSNATSANTASTIVARDGSGNFTAGALTITSALASSFLGTTASNGLGIRFWNGDSQYSIYMSSSGDGTYGGRLDSTSDYNIYFKMTGGTNRGFVFENGTTSVAQIDGGGNFYLIGNIIGDAATTITGIASVTATTFTGALSGNATTASAWATGRTITLTGNVTGVSGAWTGSGNISFATTIASLPAISGAALTSLTAANLSGAVPNANISGTYTGFTGITSSGAVISSANGAAFSVTNGTQGWITFGGSGGVGAPTFTTRSVGTKIILYDVLDGTNVDYALGVDSNTFWLATKTTATSFKFYGGTTLAAQLYGDGVLRLGNGTVSAPSISFLGDTNTGIYWGGTDTIAFTTAGTLAMTIDASGNTNIMGALGVASGSPSANATITASKSYTTNTNRSGINNVLTLTNETLTAGRSHYGIYNDVIATQTALPFTLTIYGSYNRAISASANAVATELTTLYGGFFNVLHRATGTVTNLFALNAQADITQATSIATGMRGLNIKLNGDAGTVTDAYAIYAHTENDGSTITNLYGFYNRLDRDGGTITSAIGQYNSFEGTYTGNKIGVVNNGATALDFGVTSTSTLTIGRVSTDFVTVTPHITIPSTGIATFSNGIVVNDTVQFQTATGNKLLLYSNTYGIGVESSTQTYWSGGQHRWRTGGTSVSTGTEIATLSSGGIFTANGVAVPSTGLYLNGRPLQAFTIRIQKLVGLALQHRIGRVGDVAEANALYSNINGASVTAANTPTGTDSTTAFSSGGKIGSTLSNSFIFDTGDNAISADAGIDGLGWAVFADMGNFATSVRCFVASIRYVSRNVNGVTRVRPELRVKVVDSGGSSTAYNMTTMPDDAFIEFDVFLTSL